MARTKSLDLLRGLIMVLMALDHASAFIARKHFTEIWGIEFESYPSLIWWLTRFVSHLCAPGFFFLMGVSMALFSINRMGKDWKAGDIRLYFLKRGSLILLLMLLVEFPAWMLGMSFSEVATPENIRMFPGLNDGGFSFPTTVLYGLGICMIIGALLWDRSKFTLATISVLCFISSGMYISSQGIDQTFSSIETLLLVPTVSNDVMSIYPVLPWLGVMTGGMLWAKYFFESPRKTIDNSLYIGIFFIVIFLLLRAMKFGNFHVADNSSFIEFFTLVKYPPSLQFILLTMGINLCLLKLFHGLESKYYMGPILLFGQTAMFFYLLHLYLYGIVGMFFPMGAPALTLYVCWIIGLVPLYYLCRWYLGFKQKKEPSSIWRMI